MFHVVILMNDCSIVYIRSWIFFWIKNPYSIYNNTASYQQHNLCLPISVQKVSKTRKLFYLEKTLFIIFPYVSHVQSVLIFARKTSLLGREWHLRELLRFDTHSTKNMPPLRTSEKIKVMFRKNLQIFTKLTHTPKLSGNLTISVAIYGKVGEIWSKGIFALRSMNNFADVARPQMENVG